MPPKKPSTNRKRPAIEKSPPPSHLVSESEEEAVIPKKRSRTGSASKPKPKPKPKSISKALTLKAPTKSNQQEKTQAGSSKPTRGRPEPRIFVVTSTVRNNDRGHIDRCISFYSTLKSANTAAKRRLKKIAGRSAPTMYDDKGCLKTTGMSDPYEEYMVTVKERPVWGPNLVEGEADASGNDTGSELDSEDGEDDDDDGEYSEAVRAKDRMYAEEAEEGIQYVPRKQPQF